jgi:hypothetical protein
MMTQENKLSVYKGLLAVVGVLAIVGVAHAFSGSAQNVTENGDIHVYNGVPAKQVVGSEGEERVGAVASQASRISTSPAPTAVDKLFVDGDQEVDGTAYFDGEISGAATTTVRRFIQGGTVTSLTDVATSTLTAAQICNSSVLKITPVSTTPTITLPTTSTLFAAASGGCLTSNGQVITLHYQAITTSTILAAGTGGTLLTNASATVGANKGALITFIRDSATSYLAFMVSED